MIRNNSYYMTWKLRTIIALVLALAVSTFPATLSRAVRAQTPAKATPSPGIKSGGGSNEGIKVHGHWIINVRNPDGTLVTHREFENALTGLGARTLFSILGRSQKTGFWEIQLLYDNDAPFGGIYEPNDELGTADQKTLAICIGSSAGPFNIPCTVEGVTPPSGVFVVGGHFPATANGLIGKVATHMGTCPATLAGPCPTQISRPSFTERLLSPEVSVSAGQIVQVTVAISFS